MLLAVASAASPSNTLRSYLSGYMSNATVDQYSYYNLAVGGTNYIVAPSVNGTTYLVIQQQNGKYSLLTSQAAIDPILTAYFAQYENLSQVSYLNSEMHAYYKNLNGTIQDCITETGVNPPLTNNFTQAILGCQSIPICDRALYSAFGAESPFGFGIQNFSIQFGILNTTLRSYFNTVQSINASNAGDKLSGLGTDISSIGSVVNKLSTDPIFPPPASANYGSCNAGLPSQQPWYCVAVGYCGFLNANSTQLSSISSVQQQLASEIPSKAQLSSYSSASAATGSYYMAQANVRANSASFHTFLNTTYSTYNSTVAKVTALLARSPNVNLSASLSSLKASFSGILSNGINISISNEIGGYNSILSSVMSKYSAANSTLAQATSYSSNYTIIALAAELNYRDVPPKLSQLAAQLESLDLEMNSGVNTTTAAALLPEMQVIGLQLNVFTPITTMGSIVKTTDGWFIGAMLGGSNAFVQSKIAAAPTYAALLSLMIGIIILVIIFLLTYGRLSKGHKLKKSRKSSMAWMALFVGILILVLIYAYMTYVYGEAANSFLPFSYFRGYLQSSKSAYVVLNGSSAYDNQGVTACAGAISAVLASEGKAVKTISATNYSCVAGGTVSPLGVGCIDSALNSGTPVIALSATGNGIVYKGLYGTILYVNGADATSNSCIAARLLSLK
jgi:hypothetical protein